MTQRTPEHRDVGWRLSTVRWLASLGLMAASLILMSGCAHKLSFASDVRPILDRNCIRCHQPGGIGYERSGLDMRSYASLMKGTKYGRVIIPGDSYDSVLVQLVEHRADQSINMPYHETGITKGEIDTLKTWIDQGAKP